MKNNRIYPNVTDTNNILVDYKYTLEPYKHWKPTICMKLLGEDVYLNICYSLCNNYK